MKIAIIAAMRKELDLILAQMPEYSEVEYDGFKAYEGNLGNHHIILAECGIGKVNSALRTQKLIDRFQPELVINSGVAGGLDALMHIGDVLVPERVAYHDVWCGPGTIPGQADGYPLYFEPSESAVDTIKDMAATLEESVKFGLICSGDKFISKPEEVQTIKKDFPEALGCDMESASIAHTCTLNKVLFLIIRVMSDMPGGGENLAEYEGFWTEAPAKTFDLLFKTINRF